MVGVGLAEFGRFVHLGRPGPPGHRAGIPQPAEDDQQEQEGDEHAPAGHIHAPLVIVAHNDAPVGLAVDQIAQVFPEHLHVVQVIGQGLLAAVGLVKLHGQLRARHLEGAHVFLFELLHHRGILQRVRGALVGVKQVHRAQEDRDDQHRPADLAQVLIALLPPVLSVLRFFSARIARVAVVACHCSHLSLRRMRRYHSKNLSRRHFSWTSGFSTPT